MTQQCFLLLCLCFLHLARVVLGSMSVVQIEYEKRAVDSLHRLKPADHIRVARGRNEASVSGLYDHHMMVIGVVSETKLKVIHYTGEVADAAAGSFSSFSSFAATTGEDSSAVVENEVELSPDDEVEVLDYPHYIQPQFSAEESIERARKRLGEKEYGLFKNNCECFVNWARIDRAVSNQAKVGTLVTSLGALYGAVQGYRGGGGLSGLAKGAVQGAHSGLMYYREQRP